MEGLEYIDYAEEEFKWIAEDEMSIIKEILTKNFNNQTCKKIFNDLRHPLVHRSNPGIDCMPLQTYEFQVREIENTKYTVVSTSYSQGTYDFEKIKADILYVWNKFVDGFEVLFSKIGELNKEVNNLEVKM
ncbi:hypothetical protein FDC50_15255 [Clostridium botulinum]|nr:hypothetical protein KU41_01115 [Clostridium botulinum]MBY6803374.1 hypothetical protein [Clostridium botulinum]MBY6813919.1 hypothetical protein [Clostridium botulinum]MBY6820140.1 hypothetical protein [Clostridium botulinum]NFJ52553.1 hypothetical protein [Clostridium botulinum]